MGEPEVKQYFNDHSTDYERGETYGTERKIEFIKERTISGGICVDLGCGDGYFLDEVGKKTSIDKLVGVDISKEMLNKYDGDADLIAGSVGDIPLSENSVDLIHIDTVLHHLVGSTRQESKKKMAQAVKDIKTILSEESYLIISEHCMTSRMIPSLIPVGLFLMLKHFSSPLSRFHPEIKSGLLVSFYTISEIREVVENCGGSVVDTYEQPIPISSLQEVVLNRRSRVHFFVEF